MREQVYIGGGKLGYGGGRGPRIPINQESDTMSKKSAAKAADEVVGQDENIGEAAAQDADGETQRTCKFCTANVVDGRCENCGKSADESP